MVKAKKQRARSAAANNIRNWRLFRGIERQEDLAELVLRCDPKGVGLPRVSITRLENGDQRYNEHHIKLLCLALRVAPRDLIGTNPFDAGDIFAIYSGLTDAKKRAAIKLIATLKR